MSEKRFTLEQWTEESLYFSDGEFSAHMSIGYICKKVEKKLNEQQATIKELEEEIKLLKPTNIEQYEQIVQLQKENEQLKEELNNLKKDETMLYHYYTLARYGGDGV